MRQVRIRWCPACRIGACDRTCVLILASGCDALRLVDPRLSEVQQSISVRVTIEIDRDNARLIISYDDVAQWHIPRVRHGIHPEHVAADHNVRTRSRVSILTVRFLLNIDTRIHTEVMRRICVGGHDVCVRTFHASDVGVLTGGCGTGRLIDPGFGWIEKAIGVGITAREDWSDSLVVGNNDVFQRHGACVGHDVHPIDRVGDCDAWTWGYVRVLKIRSLLNENAGRDRLDKGAHEGECLVSSDTVGSSNLEIAKNRRSALLIGNRRVRQPRGEWVAGFRDVCTEDDCTGEPFDGDDSRSHRVIDQGVELVCVTSPSSKSTEVHLIDCQANPVEGVAGWSGERWHHIDWAEEIRAVGRTPRLEARECIFALARCYLDADVEPTLRIDGGIDPDANRSRFTLGVAGGQAVLPGVVGWLPRPQQYELVAHRIVEERVDREDAGLRLRFLHGEQLERRLAHRRFRRCGCRLDRYGFFVDDRGGGGCRLDGCGFCCDDRGGGGRLDGCGFCCDDRGGGRRLGNWGWLGRDCRRGSFRDRCGWDSRSRDCRVRGERLRRCRYR